MKKYYYENEFSECCYTIDYFKEKMKTNNLSEMTVLEAMKSEENDFFYCKQYQEVGEKGECGSLCDKYEPRNKISGICKHHAFLHQPGKEVTITLKS